jgi:2-dehydropantoate 2-reductase
MNIVVIGTGGIGTFYGLNLQKLGHRVTFVARGENLEYLKTHDLTLVHPNYTLTQKVQVCTLKELIKQDISSIDMIFLVTKSMQTQEICEELKPWKETSKHTPYFISLQNGVENENIMLRYWPKQFVIGAITRLIAAHIIKPGHVDSTGEVQTVIGALYPHAQNQSFLEKLKAQLDKCQTTTILTSNIQLELWKKLIINNGVNAICALLQERSGTLIHHEKTSKLIYGLMSETAVASKAIGLNISQKEVDEMFELMKGFDSIKPSMWVDTQNNRDLELEDICGVVIKYCEAQNKDAPYTRSISTVLEFQYNKQRGI